VSKVLKIGIIKSKALKLEVLNGELIIDNGEWIVIIAIGC